MNNTIIIQEAPELVGVEKFCQLVGVYTEAAVRKKIYRGVWYDGQVITHAPDGHVLISMRGFYKWVESGAVEVLNPSQHASGSNSTSMGSHIAKRSIGHHRQQT